jgi:hypothetical protein
VTVIADGARIVPPLRHAPVRADKIIAVRMVALTARAMVALTAGTVQLTPVTVAVVVTRASLAFTRVAIALALVSGTRSLVLARFARAGTRFRLLLAMGFDRLIQVFKITAVRRFGRGYRPT